MLSLLLNLEAVMWSSLGNRILDNRDLSPLSCGSHWVSRVCVVGADVKGESMCEKRRGVSSDWVISP